MVDAAREAGPTEALALWGLTDARVARAPAGLNNRSWFVDAAAGRHVLRLYTTASQQEVASEHAFLLHLLSARLPFGTPRPIPARDGTTCPLVPGTTTVAALFDRIEGEHVDDDDVAGIEAAGAAFAELDKVLATMHTARGAWDGSIDGVHPLVSDLSSLEEIGAECADFVRRMAGAPSRLRATIEPRQVIHGDFAFGNVAQDARAAELATALRLVLSKGTRDLIWRPLLRGYLSHLPLTDAEIGALPTLAMQHEAVVVAWWLGRYLSAKADRLSLEQHVTRALELETWIDRHAAEIIEHARGCRQAPRRRVSSRPPIGPQFRELLQTEHVLSDAPPPGVLRAFGATEPPKRFSAGRARTWAAGDVVLKTVDDVDEASWIADLAARVKQRGFRLSRPIAASDGRWIVDGWSAWTHVAGKHSKTRWAEVLEAAASFHAAVVSEQKPEFIERRVDRWRIGDRVAWG